MTAGAKLTEARAVLTALLQYATHLSSCAIETNRSAFPRPKCTCGVAVARQAAEVVLGKRKRIDPSLTAR